MQLASTHNRNPRIIARWLVALAAAGLCGAASAQIYGWTDASGEVTYSNLPPPKGAKVTDVIRETPLSPQAVAEAAKRSEISALNDRIRLLELEAARSKREVVDYSAAPEPAAPPPGSGCGSEGYSDCNSQWGPYYTTGFLYGSGERRRHDHDRDRDHDGGSASVHPGHAPQHANPQHANPQIVQPMPPAQQTHIAASPNKSSISDR